VTAQATRSSTPASTGTVTFVRTPTASPTVIQASATATSTPEIAGGEDSTVLQVVPMPNPQAGPVFCLAVDLSGTAEGLQVKIYSNSLLLVQHVTIPGALRRGWNAVSFRLGEVPNGLYFLKVSASKGQGQAEGKIGRLYVRR
jgi:hypothetical protein